MAKIYLTIALSLILHELLAQPQIQWQKTMGGKGEETARQLIHTIDNGYLIAGTADISDGDVTGVHPSTTSFLGPDGTYFYEDDIWLVKLNSQQQVVWQKCLGGNGEDTPMKLLELANGEFILIANTGSGNVGGPREYGNGEVLVYRLRANGDIMWQKVFGGNGIDRAYSGVETGNGDIIIVGYSESTVGDVQNNQGKGDGWILRIDASGTLLWKNCLGTTSYDRLQAIAKSGNGYLVFGQTAPQEYNNQGSRVWVSRIADDGTVQWQRFPCNLALPIAISASGPDYIMAGYTYRNTLSGARYDKDLWVARIDSAATLRWERIFGGLGEDAASSILLLSDSTLVVGGSTSSNEADVFGKQGQSADNWLLNIDPNGLLRWQYCLGGTEKEGEVESSAFVWDKLYSFGALATDADGGLLWASYSRSRNGDVTLNRPYMNKPTNDLWMIKFAPDLLNPFQVGLIQPGNFCNRQLQIPFHADQAFAAGTTFSVELSDRKGSFTNPVPLPVVGTSSPLTVTLPDTLRGGFGYRVRIGTGTLARTSAPSNRFNPNTTASVIISGDSTVKSGSGAILKLRFSGGPPYSYTLSNGLAALTNTESITINVPTMSPTVYTVQRLSNLCGTGMPGGRAAIDVAYCTPYVYNSCQGTGRIDDFRLTSDTDIPLLVNNNSGCSQANYGDFTKLATAPVARLGRYKLTTRLQGSGAGRNYLTIWIDYNQDRVLAASELVFQRDFSQVTATISGSFVIPASAKVGLTRMRVYATYGLTDIQSCYASDYGEYEDYSLFIQDSGEADLSLQVVTDKRVAAVNEPVTITAQLTNRGSLEATNVTLSTKLPPNLQFIDSPDWQAGPANELSLMTGLQAGETKIVSFRVRALAPGTYLSWTQVTRSDRYDPDSRPNSGTGDGEDDAAGVSFRTVEPGSSLFISPNPGQIPLPVVSPNQPKPDSSKADLSVRMTLSSQVPLANELTSLSLVVANQGGLATGGIALRLTLPPNIHAMINGQPVSDTYIVQLSATLPAGGTTTFPLSIRATQPGMYVIGVEITSAELADPDSVVNNGLDTGEDDTGLAFLRVR